MSSDEFDSWDAFYTLERDVQREQLEQQQDQSSTPTEKPDSSKPGSYVCTCPDGKIQISCQIHGPRSAT